LEELQGAWNSLVFRSSFPNFFSSYEWVRSWWKIFGKGKEEWVWGFYQSGTLIGIAPMALSGKSLSFIGTGLSDRLDFIIEKGKEGEFLLSFLDLIQEQGCWDLLDLQEVDSESPTSLFFQSLVGRVSPGVYLQSKLPFLSLPSTWEEFLGRYSKKRRDKISYYPRNLGKSFPYWIEEIEEENLPRGLEFFFKLHLSRFKRKLMPTLLMLPRFREFHLELARGLSGKGTMKIFLLLIKGEPAGSLYGFQFGDRFNFYLSGQDERYHPFGLGFILQIHAIKTAIEKGIKYFDFLRGIEGYKTHWKPGIRQNFRIITHKRTLRGKISFNVKRIEHGITDFIKKRAGRI
jgi:CelD/BcsL family acetyltransferase involved in cellulose biosynthesis